MCKKLIYLACFCLLLGFVLTNTVSAADPSLQGWWKLDETSGMTAADSSVNGNHGTLGGNPVWIPGQIKGAVELDGNGDYVQLPIGSIISTLTEATFATWVNFYNSGGAWQRVFDFGSSTTVNMFVTPAVGTVGNLRFALTTGGSGAEDQVNAANIMPTGWHHLAVTVSGSSSTIVMYLDGQVVGNNTSAVNNVSSMGNTTNNWLGRSQYGGDAYFEGAFDDFFIFNRILTQAQIQGLMEGYQREVASEPSPEDGETDVFRDVILSWKPGIYAQKHNVYLGTNSDDVSNAGAGSPLLVGSGLSSATFDSGRLEFSQRYFWRVDEVNAPPSNTVFKGGVWSFTVEPSVYPISAENIIATASSQTGDQGPEKTIDGSGLDENNLHSTDPAAMWLSTGGEPGSAWIQYEFDKPYMLLEMSIWNYNGNSILSLYGIKEVTIEYSTDGTTWTQAGISELAQATGAEGYAPNTTVAFDSAAVKYVKITANNNWIGGTGIFNKYGLSEVKFMYLPVSARKPSPEEGATDVAIDATLIWRAGREAAQHKVYLSTDLQAVIDGSVSASTVNQNSYSPPPLDLGSLYFWRVDEVNNIEATPTWQSSIWSFITQDYLVVDDFESYNDIPSGQEGSNLVYEKWIDGYANPATNGSTMGYVTGSSFETDNIYGGEQAVPLLYDNTTASKSEVTVNPGELPIGRNWSIGSPQALVLWIYGDPGNAATDRLYVKIGNAKVLYDGDIARPQWRQWSIDLAALGINLNNVATLTIGLERTGGAGGTGFILLDEIRLYGVAPELPEQIWLEAEAANSITAPFAKFTELESASGGQYIGKTDGAGNNTSPITDGSATATYTFTVSGGVYMINCRIYGYGTSDGFWVQIPDAIAIRTVTGDDAVLTNGWLDSNNMAEGTFWHWGYIVADDNTDDPAVEFTLAAGTHTLRIANRDDGTMLDAIVITKID